jgi:hypothetical protein
MQPLMATVLDFDAALGGDAGLLLGGGLGLYLKQVRLDALAAVIEPIRPDGERSVLHSCPAHNPDGGGDANAA